MADRIAYQVTLSSPCKGCGNNDQFAKFVKEGNVFHSCSFKVGSQYCNGKPVDNDDYKVLNPGKVVPKADPALVAQYFGHRFEGGASSPAAPTEVPTPGPQAGASASVGATAGSPHPASGSYADLFDKLSDCHAEMSSIYNEIAAKFKGAGR